MNSKVYFSKFVHYAAEQVFIPYSFLDFLPHLVPYKFIKEKTC